MSNFLEKEKCSIHNQSCVAIDFAQTVDADGLMQCVKCMADKLSQNHFVLLNDETIIMLKEIKQKEFDRQKCEIDQSLGKYQTSMIKIQDYMDWQNGCLNKILIQFNSQIESLQNQLKNMKEPKVEDLEKSDLQVLQQVLNGLQISNQDIVNDINQEGTTNFLEQVEKQLQSLDLEQKFKQILSHLNKIINEKETVQEQIEQKVENYFDNGRTPFLQHKCSKHGQEIILFTLDEDYQGERALCIDCIPKFKNELIPIKDANNLWFVHQSEVYDTQNKFLFDREQKQIKIKKIIQSFKDKYQQLQNELLQLIETQDKDISNQILDLQNNKTKQSLMKLEIKELKIAINQLSQKDKLNKLRQQQMQQINDQKYQKEILKKLIEIEQTQKDCKQEFFKLFDFNDSLFEDVQIEIEKLQNEISNTQLDSTIFTNLIPKFQNEVLNNLSALMKTISDKGHQYIEYLNTPESNIKNQEQEQMRIIEYQVALSQFDQKYKIMAQTVNFAVNKLNEFQWPCYLNIKLLKFSTSLKHQDITISADGKTAKSTSSGWNLCLCDQPIPKYGTVVVDFKVKQLYGLMAGVCLIDSINKNYHNSYGISKGCYFLYTTIDKSYIYSQHDQQKNEKPLGFPMQQNDIISMEVNVQQKQITWRNKAKNQVYTLDIQTTSDLYFCFHFSCQNEIELV